MKSAFVLATTIFAIQLVCGNDRVPEPELPRVLLLPFSVDPVLEEPWAGLAPVLALHERAGDDPRLVPFTACRRKLNEYGLSVVLPISLATRVKLAADLDADLLVTGHLEKERLVLLLYHVRQKTLQRRLLDVSEMDELFLQELAGIAALPFKALSGRQYDLFRVWASFYYAEELENVRATAGRLLEHDLTGWLFVQEYLDLFGDPSSGLTEAADLAWWRDFFLKKQHHARALHLSQQVMTLRHHPQDLIAHARVLLALEDVPQACDFLTKAESFGFVDDTMRQDLHHCTRASDDDVTETEIR